jgi:hypothetical protein
VRAAGIEAALFAVSGVQLPAEASKRGHLLRRIPQPSTVAGTFRSMEVRRRDAVIAKLWEALGAWEAGGDRALLRRALLGLLSVSLRTSRRIEFTLLPGVALAERRTRGAVLSRTP